MDVSFNAVGLPQPGIQGIALIELTEDYFARPSLYTSSHFITATAAARHMTGQGSGVIVTLTSTPARAAAALAGGMAPAWAALEAFSRSLAAELGPAGIRVLCLRLKRLPTLAEVADTAAFIASDRASAMTAAVANLGAGSITD